MKKFLIFAIGLVAVVAFSSCNRSTAESSSQAAGDVAEAAAVADVEDYDGPSDVDMLDLPVTDSEGIDLLLDDIEYNIEGLENLINSGENNLTAMENVSNRIARLANKIAENADFCTTEQVDRLEELNKRLGRLCE